jgi:hypothetical protein
MSDQITGRVLLNQTCRFPPYTAAVEPFGWAPATMQASQLVTAPLGLEGRAYDR